MFKKTKSKKGFTLVELLIVLAIIAILAAIAIPTYSAQMEKARKKVDEANMRSAKSLATAEYMLNVDATTKKTYYFEKGDDGNIGIFCTAAGVPQTTAPSSGYNEAKQGTIDADGAAIAVEVTEGGEITNFAWVAAGGTASWITTP